MNARELPMNSEHHRYERPPIIEAVVDLDCDMRPGLDGHRLREDARAALRDDYPTFRTQLVEQHTVENPDGKEPILTKMTGIRAFRFQSQDLSQIVQVRVDGFSFNRMRPYSSLDHHLPEIQRTWEIFVRVAEPVMVRKVGLRYINRVPVPTVEGKVRLEEYLTMCPQLPNEDDMMLAGFLHQHQVQEISTGNFANIVLTAQAGESGSIPIILDIEAFTPVEIDPVDWDGLAKRIESLRRLKNLIFERSITDTCRNLFQP